MIVLDPSPEFQFQTESVLVWNALSAKNNVSSAGQQLMIFY